MLFSTIYTPHNLQLDNIVKNERGKTFERCNSPVPAISPLRPTQAKATVIPWTYIYIYIYIYTHTHTRARARVYIIKFACHSLPFAISCANITFLPVLRAYIRVRERGRKSKRGRRCSQGVRFVLILGRWPSSRQLRDRRRSGLIRRASHRMSCRFFLLLCRFPTSFIHRVYLNVRALVCSLRM
jgi:hypothetical protein